MFVRSQLAGLTNAEARRVLEGLPRAGEYEIVVKPLRYRTRPHLAARRDRRDEIASLNGLGTHLHRLVAPLRGGQSADRRQDEDHPAEHGHLHTLAHNWILGGEVLTKRMPDRVL